MLLPAYVVRFVLEFRPDWEEYVLPDGTMLTLALRAWYGTESAAALWHADIQELLLSDRCGYTLHKTNR